MQTTAAKNSLFISASPMLQQAIIKSGLLHAASDELASRLAAIAESLYINRAVEPLREATDLLISLPMPQAKAAGLFYKAMCECIAGTDEKAALLLQSVIGMNCAPRYQARALQSLGVILRLANDKEQATELYQRAIRQAENHQDIVTVIRAGMNLAELRSTEGDHERALEQLRAIRPAVELATQVSPIYAPMFCNEVAYDLARLGRLEEAQRLAAFAIASPFARVYPEWQATALEIEKQAREKATRKRIQRPAVERVHETSIKPKLRQVKKPCPVALPASTRRRIGPVAIIRPERPRSRPTLEQLCLKIRIRAPSF